MSTHQEADLPAMSEGHRPSSIAAVRLNHAVLFVTDLEPAVQFWTTAFAMTVVAREPQANAAFLRLARSGNHHDLGLFGNAAPSHTPGSVGLYHLAWQVDTVDELVAARQSLARLDAYTGESSHGATKSIYGTDPDGNEFEVMWMLPPEHWGTYADTAPVDRLDLAAEIARWSGVPTAARVAAGTSG